MSSCDGLSLVEIEMIPEPDEDSVHKVTVEQRRLCPHTGAVVGATAVSLINMITVSADHTALSEFFLIYRLMITPHELLQLLLERFATCLDHKPISLIVNTANTLKYWVDVFFADDFLPSFALRSEFATSMAVMVKTVNSKPLGVIFRRLRDAWHRQCQKYWDIPNLDISIFHFTAGGLPGRSTIPNTEIRDSLACEDFRLPMTTSASSLIRGHLDGVVVCPEKKANSSGLLQSMRSALSLRSLHSKRDLNEPECLQSPIHWQQSLRNKETFIRNERSNRISTKNLYSHENCEANSLQRSSLAPSTSVHGIWDRADSKPELALEESLNTSRADSESPVSSVKLDALVSDLDLQSPDYEPTPRLKRKPGGNLRSEATVEKLWYRPSSRGTITTQHSEPLPPSPLFQRSFGMGLPVEGMQIDVFDASEDEGVSIALEKLEGRYIRKDADNITMEISPDTTLEDHVLDGAERRRRRQNQVIGAPMDMRIASNNSSLLNGSFQSLQADIDFLDLPQSPRYQARTPSLGRAFYDPFISARLQSEHPCFCLSHSVKEVVQQFTLLEKDALLELDWMELLTFRWNTVSHEQVCSWNLYVNSPRPRGIDLVISRFNLMTNWVISEILLTRSLKIRVQVVNRMIEIAAEARRVRNFATCVQVMAALQSQKVARLKATWARISPRSLKVYRKLQVFTMPQRNWRNLRLEMEVENELATIPLIIVYLSDLVFNAERPDFVSASGYDENMSLIHYDKHRNTAKIVKRLLRAIHQGRRYTYPLIDGLWETCLWVTALHEEELWECSFAIEN